MNIFFKPVILSVLASTFVGCGESAKAPVAPSSGEVIFMGTCRACHAQGINGAPIFGNKKMWAKRLPQGMPTLIEHATQGYGLMPAKGGNTDLSVEDISDAVNYMVAAVKE
jgi:cytochrome c5